MFQSKFDFKNVIPYLQELSKLNRKYNLKMTFKNLPKEFDVLGSQLIYILKDHPELLRELDIEPVDFDFSKTKNFSDRLMKCFSSNSELSKLGFKKGFKDIAINFPIKYKSQVLYTRDSNNSVEYLYPKSYYDILALAMSEGKIHPNIKLSQIELDNTTYTLMTCEKAGDLLKVIPKDVAIKIIQLWDKNKRLHDLEGFVDSEEDGDEFEKLLESCGLNDDKYAKYSAPEIVEACRYIASK